MTSIMNTNEDLQVKKESGIPSNTLALIGGVFELQHHVFAATEISQQKESWLRLSHRRRSCTSLSGFMMILCALASIARPATAQFPTSQPSIVPSTSPSTHQPSLAPTKIPTSIPTTIPPSLTPSTAPSDIPSLTPLPSPSPSASPTGFPTLTPKPTLSPKPTDQPSVPPSFPPTLLPTNLPSFAPTTSFRPSMSPTVSQKPSEGPTESPEPTSSPSSFPTITPRPTSTPTKSPSEIPTLHPSESPTSLPTYSVSFSSVGQYGQSFFVPDGRPFNENQTMVFEWIMEGYTLNITDSPDRIEQINVSCAILLQNVFQPVSVRRNRRLGGNRSLQESSLPDNQVVYTLTWFSIYANVTDYPALFVNFINLNLDVLTNDLRKAGLNVSNSSTARAALVTSPPSLSPSISAVPSGAPSFFPSPFPSHPPTELPSVSPTGFPTIISTAPTDGSSNSSSSNSNTVILAVVLVLVIFFGGGGIAFYFYRRRSKKGRDIFEVEAADSDVAGSDPGRLTITTSDPFRSERQTSDSRGDPVISPSESLLSNPSLLSTGDSVGGDSIDEPDGRHNLADEFDQYKDQNLEKVRAGVEEMLSGADGMISRAMTLALMTDEDEIIDKRELYWGGTGNAIEIEASVLCDVNDFLKKRKEIDSGIGESRTFMQNTMNKMVASVRHGVIRPEEATRTIHECAAMLGLELAVDIPVNTVIVTGMRKNVTTSDLELAFREFGDIDEMAVAASARGFGLVRFLSPQSAQRAMDKFVQKEIVVQDVAVMVKILKSDGIG